MKLLSFVLAMTLSQMAMAKGYPRWICRTKGPVYFKVSAFERDQKLYALVAKFKGDRMYSYVEGEYQSASNGLAGFFTVTAGGRTVALVGLDSSSRDFTGYIQYESATARKRSVTCHAGHEL